MDLQAFVRNALVQIVEGIKGAQDATAESMSGGSRKGRINPSIASLQGDMAKQGFLVSSNGEPVRLVEFDVAVTVEEKAGAETGIKVLGLSIGGDLQNKEASTSRLRFAVPIEYPREP
jgi:hypothetical protein